MDELLQAIRNLANECRNNDVELIGILVDEVSKKKIEAEIPDTNVRIICGNDPDIAIGMGG